MDSFFGIGVMELAFIAILALIILGPERLPGAARETAKIFGQIRALSNEFTSQFSEELQMLDEINPKKLADDIVKDTINPPKKVTPAPETQPLNEQSQTTPEPAPETEEPESENSILPPAMLDGSTTTSVTNGAAKEHNPPTASDNSDGSSSPVEDNNKPADPDPGDAAEKAA